MLTLQDSMNSLSLAADLLKLGASPVVLKGDCLRHECQQLFDEWKNRPHATAY